MTKKYKYTEVLLGWVIFFSWLIVTALVASRLLIPFVTQEVLGMLFVSLPKEVASMAKFFMAWGLCILSGFLTSYALSYFLTRFLQGTSLWKWFLDVEQQTIAILEKKIKL